MPRSKFKPLTLGSLPRVMVSILAMSEEDRQMIAEAMREEPEYVALMNEQFSTTGNSFPVWMFATEAEHLASIFDAVLQRPKEWRAMYTMALDNLLNRLRQGDAFGTEGQDDPRGDHRE